ncbi:MAG: hypothetical protein ABIJ92_02820 [Candidatus Aenigmatarchaeota archaeon]
MRSGQTEIIIIVGLVVVVGAVVFLAVQGLLPTDIPITGIDNQKRVIENSVLDFITEATLKSIDNVTSFGGYVNPNFPLGSVNLNGKPVPYWHTGDETEIPDIKRNLVDGITEYLNQNKKYIIEGKSVTIDDALVSVNLQNDKAIVTVTMPTTFWFDEKPHPIQQPYVVEIPTRLGKISAFSKSFLTEQGSNAPIETFTLSTMMLSPFEENTRTIPILIQLTECGESVYKSWYDIKPEVEAAIEATLARTYLPGEYPINTLRTSSGPKYSLPPLDNNDYSDLDVTFHTPDDFELNPSTLQIEPNPIISVAKPIPLTTVCVSDPIIVKYFLTYPIIVRAKDDLTGNTFQFVTQAYIKDNRPVSYDTGFDFGDQERTCANAQCSINMNARNSLGEPLTGAHVSFMGCVLGQTDSSGLIQGQAPCGVGVLRFDSNGYASHEEMKSTSNENQENELVGTVEMNAVPVINMKFYQVVVQNWTGGQYAIPNGGIEEIDGDLRLDFSPRTTSRTYSPIVATGPSATVSHLVEDNYLVAGVLTESDSTRMLGGFGDEYTLTASDKNLYIYIPIMVGIDSLDEEGKALSAFIMSSILRQCGIGPVRNSKFIQTEGCVANVGV